MKITAIKQQTRDDNRVNVFVDGKYKFSLDVSQLLELGIKVGNEYDAEELAGFGIASSFGKLYGRALEYCLIRPRSLREMKDYLYKKTRPTRSKSGELRPGVDGEIAGRVMERLTDRGYVDDYKFTQFWIDNRNISKGVSRRKLVAELRAKGVSQTMIDECLGESGRSDNQEILKVIAKKRSRYATNDKLMAYLARLGFGYDDIKKSLDDYPDFD
jgi:regulatory protein